MRTQRGAVWSHMLMEREMNLNRARAVDRAEWYLPKKDLLSPKASSLFTLSYLDQSTQEFIDDSFSTSESICLQMWYSLSSVILSMIFTKTNINGLLGRGGMFLFSTDQMREFLQLPTEWTSKGAKLLDLGSGDGGVTKHLAELFEEVHVTEMSTMMQWRLQQKGYILEDAQNWHTAHSNYSLISVLNLLDRHFNPRLLLSQLHKKASESNCPVLLSLVLPIRPYVEFHPNGTSVRPDAYLDVAGRSLEEQAGSLIEGEFLRAGFECVRWTKLPYLCEGDFNKPYYRLDDVLFLLRPIPISTPNMSAVDNQNIVPHQEL